MSDRIVYPRRNLGPAEPWGRSVEGGVDRLDTRLSTVETTQASLSRSVSGLAGLVQPLAESRMERVTQSSVIRNPSINTSGVWTTLASVTISLPPGDKPRVLAGVTSILQLNPSSQSVTPPWVRLSWSPSSGSEQWMPDSQGATAMSGVSGPFTASISTVFDSNNVLSEEVTIHLQAWSDSSSNFATPSSSSLAYILADVSFSLPRVE